jgi:hypothetical protein
MAGRTEKETPMIRRRKLLAAAVMVLLPAFVLAPFVLAQSAPMYTAPAGNTGTYGTNALGAEVTTPTCAGWTFTTSTPGWTDCTANVLTRTAFAGNFTATGPTVTAGVTYKVVWSPSLSAGPVISLGGVTSPVRSTPGTYTEIMTATATTAVTITVAAATTGSIDLSTVSVKPITTTPGVTIAANGSVSAPVLWMTGNWNTGTSATTTKPMELIEPAGTTSTAWSTAGTGLGINAASGFAGNLIDAQVNGTSVFKVSSGGTVTSGSVVSSGTGTFTSGTNSSNYATTAASGGLENIARNSEALVLNTGATTTPTVGSLAIANSRIDAIAVRVTSAIGTAANFGIRVTGGNAWCVIGTAGTTQGTVTTGATVVFVPCAFADGFVSATTTLTVTTNVNPSAGALRIQPYYTTYTPPTS